MKKKKKKNIKNKCILVFNGYRSAAAIHYIYTLDSETL